MLARCGYCDIKSKFMDGIVLVLKHGYFKAVSTLQTGVCNPFFKLMNTLHLSQESCHTHALNLQAGLCIVWHA